jgi:hypothetical protein
MFSHSNTCAILGQAKKSLTLKAKQKMKKNKNKIMAII